MSEAKFELHGEGPEGPKWLSFPCQQPGSEADDQCRVPINGQRNASGAAWQMTGSVEAPTLTPSVHCVGFCHFFLRDGRFQHCGDYPARPAREDGHG